LRRAARAARASARRDNSARCCAAARRWQPATRGAGAGAHAFAVAVLAVRAFFMALPASSGALPATRFPEHQASTQPGSSAPAGSSAARGAWERLRCAVKRADQRAPDSDRHDPHSRRSDSFSREAIPCPGVHTHAATSSRPRTSFESTLKTWQACEVVGKAVGGCSWPVWDVSSEWQSQSHWQSKRSGYSLAARL